MSMRKPGRRVACVLGLMLSLTVAVHAAPLRLVLTNAYAPKSLTAQTDQQFAEIVRYDSNGQILISTWQGNENPYNGVLQLSAVRAGTIQIATIFSGPLGSVDSTFLFTSLPFSVTNVEQSRAIYQCMAPTLEARTQALGLHLLSVTPWPPTGIWSTIPLKSLDDIRTLRIRTYDATGAAVFARLGAEGDVLATYSEMQAALASGEINAALTAGDGGGQNPDSIWQYLKHFTAVRYSVPMSYTVINLTTWNALTDAQRKLLTDAAAQSSALVWLKIEQQEAVDYTRMREHGVITDEQPALDILHALHDAGVWEVANWLKNHPLPNSAESCLHQQLK